MPYNSFREAINIPAQINSNEMIFFDNNVNTSEDYFAPGVLDIGYEDNIENDNYGAFIVKRPGPIVISWTASQITGLSIDGTFLELRYREFSHVDSGIAVYKPWQSLGSKTVLKNSSADGMGCVWIGFYDAHGPGTEKQLKLGPNYEPIYIGLFNASENVLQINRQHYQKASIILFGIDKMGGEMTSQLIPIQNKILNLPRPSSDYVNHLNILKSELGSLEVLDLSQNEVIAGGNGLLNQYRAGFSNYEKMTHTTIPVTLKSTIPGLGASVIAVGNLHNFWNDGQVTTLHPIQADSTNPYSEVRIYLGQTKTGDVVNYLPLTWFTADTPSVGMCYVMNNDASDDFIPIYLDETGIYLKVKGSYQFKPGATFNFIRSVILAPPIT